MKSVFIIIFPSLFSLSLFFVSCTSDKKPEDSSQVNASISFAKSKANTNTTTKRLAEDIIKPINDASKLMQDLQNACNAYYDNKNCWPESYSILLEWAAANNYKTSLIQDTFQKINFSANENILTVNIKNEIMETSTRFYRKGANTPPEDFPLLPITDEISTDIKTVAVRDTQTGKINGYRLTLAIIKTANDGSKEILEKTPDIELDYEKPKTFLIDKKDYLFKAVFTMEKARDKDIIKYTLEYNKVIDGNNTVGLREEKNFQVPETL